ncbi:skin secretory protein xP2-like [Melospiza georgiana]|uniref:skin secretory protein xP2-like n=1 Tax=Melospiza georgiana TaxID=44398 RepID=UPI0025AC014B|nr:skin secretory protein xP2-like [Melospiza georgiana]
MSVFALLGSQRRAGLIRKSGREAARRSLGSQHPVPLLGKSTGSSLLRDKLSAGESKRCPRDAQGGGCSAPSCPAAVPTVSHGALEPLAGQARVWGSPARRGKEARTRSHPRTALGLSADRKASSRSSPLGRFLAQGSDWFSPLSFKTRPEAAGAARGADGRPEALGERPVPTAHGERPVPTALGEGPVPTALGERPVPTAHGERPVPTAHGERPVPTALGERPVPTAHGERPVPTALGEGPVPTAHREGPVPTALGERPVPTALGERPVPTALGEGPVPTALGERPVPTAGPRSPPAAARGWPGALRLPRCAAVPRCYSGSKSRHAVSKSPPQPHSRRLLEGRRGHAPGRLGWASAPPATAATRLPAVQAKAGSLQATRGSERDESAGGSPCSPALFPFLGS